MNDMPFQIKNAHEFVSSDICLHNINFFILEFQEHQMCLHFQHRIKVFM